jgi:hypothetical protein
VYDSFLDKSINYAFFSRDYNSFLKFRNPFAGTQNFTQAAVMVWFRLPQWDIGSGGGSYGRGSLVECSNQLFVQFQDNSTVRFNVTTNHTNKNGD